MRDKLTADDILTATKAMEEKKANWEAEHPDEKMPVCPRCGNTGLRPRWYDERGNELDVWQVGAYEYLYPCGCITLDKRITLRNNRKFSSVPTIYKNAEFSNFDTQIYTGIESKQIATSALKDAVRFVEKFKEYDRLGLGLYIYSEQRGCGKTRLASTISNELTKRGIRVKFESANRILSEIQKSWNDRSESESTIIDKYITPRVLIIDDFGARSGKDWMDEKFLMIIDARYSDGKVTIFTSNYRIDRLPFNDSRITDRLSDVERMHPVRMPKESVRLKNRTQGDGDLFYKV